MGSTLVQVLPLALGAAISPVLVLLQVATLASPRHALVRSFCVLAGTVVVTAAVMVVVVIGDHTTSGRVDASAVVVRGWIELVLAVVLAAGGVRILLASRPDDAPPPPPADDRVHAGRSVLLGIVAMVTNVTTIVLLVPATHRSWTAPLPTADRVVLLVVVGTVTLLPASLPPLAIVGLGRRGPSALAALSGFLHRHQRVITAVVALGFAAAFLWSGLRAVG